MIDLVGVSDFPIVGGKRRILAGCVTLRLPRGRYALLSRDLEIRRHAIDIFGGLRPPEAGRILRNGLCSWPIGRAGFIRGHVNGYHLAHLVARLYGVDVALSARVVAELLTDPDLLTEKVEHWPAAMRLEFAHAIALLPAFDIYMVDGVFPWEKNRFSALWRELFEKRLENSTLILSTTRVNEVKEFCDKGLVIDRGRMEIVDDIEVALARFPIRPVSDGKREPPTEEGVDEFPGA